MLSNKVQKGKTKNYKVNTIKYRSYKFLEFFCKVFLRIIRRIAKSLKELMQTKKNKLQRAYWRMPWYMAPRKDVTSCEKLRRVANER